MPYVLQCLSPTLLPLPTWQERAAELAAHEESLEAWKSQFKAEAVRQIAERERLLGEWQGRLERRQAELEDLQRSAEVGPFDMVACLLHMCLHKRAPAVEAEDLQR